jgi:phospholipid/cholesterol/gamma-HCH transport system substrate-binding protein
MDTHSQSFKIRLGLFVIGGLVIFIIAIFIIGKQKNLFNPVFKLTTSFKNVSGLQVGNKVRFLGIDVGTVDKIIIVNDSTVMVDMLIRKNVHKFIKEDCIVAVGSEGLIGDRLLIITGGSLNSPLAKEDHHLASIEPLETDAIMKSLEVSTKNAEIITEQLAMVMLKVNTGKGTLGRLIHDSTIAQNLDQSVMNIRQITKGVDDAVYEIRIELSKIMSSVQVTTGNVEDITQHFEDIVTNINTGTGTLTMLIKDSATAENVGHIIKNLNKSTATLDEVLLAVKNSFLLKGYFKKKEKNELIKEENINVP